MENMDRSDLLIIIQELKDENVRLMREIERLIGEKDAAERRWAELVEAVSRRTDQAKEKP